MAVLVDGGRRLDQFHDRQKSVVVFSYSYSMEPYPEAGVLKKLSLAGLAKLSRLRYS